MAIHATAIIDKAAELDPTVKIGAYAIIEEGVRIGPETRVYPHAYVASGTTIGRGCQVYPHTMLGGPPQDLKFDGAPSYVQVGDETIIREGATIHRGTTPGSTTHVGQRCFLMANSHVGHNCVVADDVKLANGALLSGHVDVGRGAFISGNAALHQFVRIGELVMVAGLARGVGDVPPFMLLARDGVAGVNVIGMRRAGFTAEQRAEISACHRILYRSNLRFRAAIERVIESVKTEPGQRLADFLRQPSRRGYLGPRRRGRGTAYAGELP
ncbi:MAG: acyl-ACP--UDP-N-acetylglucosamine O-acyltransferase [Planctomycetes bacterium]|nr:acyl-ACP--UDP-N-acetylglucosamine O-acyltransferase [Planctomycetota bacterium]